MAGVDGSSSSATSSVGQASWSPRWPTPTSGPQLRKWRADERPARHAARKGERSTAHSETWLHHTSGAGQDCGYIAAQLPHNLSPLRKGRLRDAGSAQGEHAAFAFGLSAEVPPSDAPLPPMERETLPWHAQEVQPNLHQGNMCTSAENGILTPGLHEKQTSAKWRKNAPTRYRSSSSWHSDPLAWNNTLSTRCPQPAKDMNRNDHVRPRTGSSPLKRCALQQHERRHSSQAVAAAATPVSCSTASSISQLHGGM